MLYAQCNSTEGTSVLQCAVPAHSWPNQHQTTEVLVCLNASNTNKIIYYIIYDILLVFCNCHGQLKMICQGKLALRLCPRKENGSAAPRIYAT